MGGLSSEILIGGNLFIISVKLIFELLLNLGVFGLGCLELLRIFCATLCD